MFKIDINLVILWASWSTLSYSLVHKLVVLNLVLMNSKRNFSPINCHFSLYVLAYFLYCILMSFTLHVWWQVASDHEGFCYSSCAASVLTPAIIWIIMSFSSLLFSLKSYCLELEKHLSCASLYSVQWTRNSFFRFLLSLITKSLGLPVGLVSQFLFPVCDHWILYLVRVCLCFAYL